ATAPQEQRGDQRRAEQIEGGHDEGLLLHDRRTRDVANTSVTRSTRSNCCDCAARVLNTRHESGERTAKNAAARSAHWSFPPWGYSKPLQPFVAPSPTANARAGAVISECIESRRACNSHATILGAKTDS